MMNRSAIVCLAVGLILTASTTCTWGDISDRLYGLETEIPPTASDSFNVGPLTPGSIEGVSIRLQGTFTMGRAHRIGAPWDTIEFGTIAVTMAEPEGGKWMAEIAPGSGTFSADTGFNWFGQGESSWSFLEDGAATVEVRSAGIILGIYVVVRQPSIDVSYALGTIETSPPPPPPAYPPTVSTRPLSVVGDTYARLRGYVDDDGNRACEYMFRWKKSEEAMYEYAGWRGSARRGAYFSYYIGNLSPETTYDFGVRARNSAGESDWSDGSFTTDPPPDPPVPPTVSTRSASNVGDTYATLRGYVDNDGREACEYMFRWKKSEEATYEDTGWRGSVETGDSFGWLIRDLSPDTTYDFGVRARNSAGESDWSDDSFTTDPEDVPKIEISGRITQNGVGFPNVGVTAEGTSNHGDFWEWTPTYDSGDYDFRLPYGFTGTITPHESGYTFDPPNREYDDLTSGQSGEDFTARNGGGSINVTAPVVFEDSFPSTTIDSDKWTFVYGAEVDDKGTNEPSPGYSLHLNGDSSGGDLIESRVIDLSSYSGATLTYYYQRKGLYGESPDAGEDLVIEYNDGSSWVELDRQLGSGPDMTDYYESSTPLPLDALHSGFRLRLQRSPGTVGLYDDWFVDDVKIVVDANQEAGSLVAWGSNSNGQCNVPAGNDFVGIAGGYFHSLALQSDGSILAWGRNIFGQCDVPAGNRFVDIAVGYGHSLALTSGGSILAWGDNSDGQCNVPAGNDLVAIAAGGHHNLALRSDSSVIAWGYNDNGQCNVPAINDFVAIAGGGYHSLALRSDASIFTWGDNLFGQCYVPTGNDFVAIAGGGTHSLALKSDGSLMAWGNNGSGQCNVPPGNEFIAIAAGKQHNLALKSDGTIVAWGNNGSGQATPPAGNHFISIDAGAYHSLAISRVPPGNGQRSDLVFCRGGECAPLYADPATPGSYIGSMELEIQTNFPGRYGAEATPTSPADGTWTAWVVPEVLGPGSVTGTLWVRGANLDLAKLPNGSGDVQVAEVDVNVVPAF